MCVCFSATHLRPLLLNDVDYVVCKISLNDNFILRCHWGTTREFLGEEPLSLFKVDVCRSQRQHSQRQPQSINRRRFLKKRWNNRKLFLPNVARPHTRVTYFFLALGIFAIVTFWGTVFFFCLIWPLPPEQGRGRWSWSLFTTHKSTTESSQESFL